MRAKRKGTRGQWRGEAAESREGGSIDQGGHKGTKKEGPKGRHDGGNERNDAEK